MSRLFVITVFMLSTLFSCAPAEDGAAPEPTQPVTQPETTQPETVETFEETAEVASGPPELEALREGGFVVFVRHPETDADPVSADAEGHLEDLGDCSLQRNLTEAGREDARRLGENVERLGVPVGDVFASPYCRTRESAGLAFGEARVSPELATPRYLPLGDPEAEERLEFLRDLFSAPPGAGTNRWVFTHELNLRLVSGVSVPQGGAVIFEPRGDDFEVFATLPPEWWEETG